MSPWKMDYIYPDYRMRIRSGVLESIMSGPKLDRTFGYNLWICIKAMTKDLCKDPTLARQLNERYSLKPP